MKKYKRKSNLNYFEYEIKYWKSDYKGTAFGTSIVVYSAMFFPIATINHPKFNVEFSILKNKNAIKAIRHI